MKRRRDRHPRMFDRPLPLYQNNGTYPDTLRVSFADGSVQDYDLRVAQPHPPCIQALETIRKWNGYTPPSLRERE